MISGVLFGHVFENHVCSGLSTVDLFGGDDRVHTDEVVEPK